MTTKTVQKAGGNGSSPAAISKAPWSLPRKTNRVSIVGMAPGSCNDAPFNEPDVEIWTVNEGYRMFPRVTRLFEIHNRKYLTQKIRNPQHLQWLQKNVDVPVYMLERFDDIPKSIEFPYRDIIKECGSNYFTNTISWMIGFALLEDFEEISIYGVDMATDAEYQAQRPSVEFFVGLAMGRGVKVDIAGQSNMLLNAFLYGVEDHKTHRIEAKFEARKRELEEQIVRGRTDVVALRAQLNQALGRRNEVADFSSAYRNLIDADPEIRKSIDGRMEEFDQAVTQRNAELKAKEAHVNQLIGALEETEQIDKAMMPLADEEWASLRRST